MYVVVVVSGHYIYQKKKKRHLKEEEDGSEDESSSLLDQNPETGNTRERSDTEMKSIEELSRNMAEGSGEIGSGDWSKDLLSSQRRGSNPPPISPADMDSELLRSLQQRRRHLRIKRLSYGIASIDTSHVLDCTSSYVSELL